MEVTVKDVCLLKFGELSSNGTYYTKQAVKQFIKDRSKSSVPLFGGVEDSVDTQNASISMNNISHEIKNLRIDDNMLKGDVRILDTMMGKALGDALLGNDIGIALRGYGDVGEDGKVNNLKVISFDICKTPSFPDAVIKSESYLKEKENATKK